MLIPMPIPMLMLMPGCQYRDFQMTFKKYSFVSKSHLFTKIPKLLQTRKLNCKTCKIKMTRNIIFWLNHKIRMPRNPPNIP